MIPTSVPSCTTPGVVPKSRYPETADENNSIQKSEPTLEAVSPPATTTTSSETFEKMQQQDNEARQRIENAIKEQNAPSRVEVTQEQLEQIQQKTAQLMGKSLPLITSTLISIYSGEGSSVRKQLDEHRSHFEERNDREEKAFLKQVSEAQANLAELPQFQAIFPMLLAGLQYNNSIELFEALLIPFIEEYTKEIKAISQQHADNVVAVYEKYSHEEVLQQILEEQNANQPTLTIDLPEDPEKIQEMITTELHAKSPSKVHLLLKNPAQMTALSQHLINNESIKELTLSLEQKESHGPYTLDDTPMQTVVDIYTYYEALEQVLKKCPNARVVTFSPAYPECASCESISLDAFVGRIENTPTLQKIVFEAPLSYKEREDVQAWLPGVQETHPKFTVS